MLHQDAATAVKRLAGLSVLKYERERKDAAASLNIRTPVLDRLVAAERDEIEPAPLYPHWNIEPWGEPVDTDILLCGVMERIQRHVFLTRQQAVAVALWIIMTWVHKRAAVHSPILLLTSAEPNSGKSTLLGMASYLVLKGMLTVSATGPVLYRSIQMYGPTCMQDEGDTAFVENEDLRAIYNSGWTRGTGVLRCHPETNEPCLFPTFSPKAIAMKGRKLPDTTLSRCVIIELKRKLPAETVADFNHIDDEGFERLRRQQLRWANDNGNALAQWEPEVPERFHNRVRMNWKLLFAIAELAGGTWKAEAWAAARAIENVRASFGTSIGIELLADIKLAFGEAEVMSSGALVAMLTSDAERPWATWARGKPISRKQLASMLSGYQIVSATVRIGDTTAKGYYRRSFADAFERMQIDTVIKNRSRTENDPSDENPGFHPSHRHEADETGTSSDFSSVTKEECDGSKNDDLFNNHAGCDRVTDGKGQNGSSVHFGDENEARRPNPPAISAGPDDSLDDLDGRWRR